MEEVGVVNGKKVKPPIVWERSRYTWKRTEAGMETLMVFIEPAPGSTSMEKRWFEIVARRFDQLDMLDVYKGEPMQFPPTVREVVIENEKHHADAKDKKNIKELYGSGKGKILIIAGSGRSLLKDIDIIRNRNRARVDCLAINGAMQAIGAENCDYFFILDWSSKKEWWEGQDTSKVKCILGAACPSTTINAFKERYYFSGTIQSSDLQREDSWKAYGELEQGYCAAFSAMHFAYKAGYERIVFVGNDFALTDNWYHWNERITASRGEYLQCQFHQDMHGFQTITETRMLRCMHMINANAIILETMGIPVVNASQEGIWAAERRADLKDSLGAEPPPMLIEPCKMETKYSLGGAVIQHIVVAA